MSKSSIIAKRGRAARGMLARRVRCVKRPAAAACVVGVGANLPSPAGSPLAGVRCALRALAGWSRARARVSDVWRTRPQGGGGGGGDGAPWYANAAIALAPAETRPAAFLARLLRLEARFGRRRTGARDAARPLDLDILDWRGRVVVQAGASPPVFAPHPRLRLRRFALAPLAEVAPWWRDPRDGAAARPALAACEGAAFRVSMRPRRRVGRGLISEAKLWRG